MSSQSYIESFAPELLFNILTRLPDLASLDNLLRASPTAYRLFDLRGREVFEAVLSFGVTHKYTCAIIRIFALFRSRTFPLHVHDLDDFRKLIRHDTTSHRYDPPEWEFLPLTLSPDTSATVLRGLLATNRKIVRLTTGCLRFYLDRFNSLRPTHLLDKNFKFVSQFQGPERLYVPSWQLHPAEEPYPVQDIGPPSWVEEQRVLRAFWRVQLFHEVGTAVNDSVINWPLNGMSVVDFYNVPTEGLSGDNEFDENSYGEPYLYQQGTLLEQELIESALHYTKENRELNGGSILQDVGQDWPICTPGGQDDCEIVDSYTSVTYTFFFEVGGRPGWHRVTQACSPLQHVTFEPFRRLGFAIWDTERMSAFGFLDPSYNSLRDHSYFLAWKSVLGQDEIEKVESANWAHDEPYCKSGRMK